MPDPLETRRRLRLPSVPVSRKTTWSHRELIRQARRQERQDPLRLAETHDVPRPRTRGECQNGVRPCPFVSCRYHLALDMTDAIAPGITMPWGENPEEELFTRPDTCALDVADRGPRTLEDVANIFNLTRERVRQVESAAIAKLKESEADDLADVLGCIQALKADGQ